MQQASFISKKSKKIKTVKQEMRHEMKLLMMEQQQLPHELNKKRGNVIFFLQYRFQTVKFNVIVFCGHKIENRETNLWYVIIATFAINFHIE